MFLYLSLPREWVLESLELATRRADGAASDWVLCWGSCGHAFLEAGRRLRAFGCCLQLLTISVRVEWLVCCRWDVSHEGGRSIKYFGGA